MHFLFRSCFYNHSLKTDGSKIKLANRGKRKRKNSCNEEHISSSNENMVEISNNSSITDEVS